MIKKLTAFILSVSMLFAFFSSSVVSADDKAITPEGFSIPPNIVATIDALGIFDTGKVSGNSTVSYENFYEIIKKLSGSPYEKPENNNGVTYMYVIRNIVSVLGYDEYASVKGDYPYNYITVANELDITDGLVISDYEETYADYNSLFVMVYNALMTDMYMIDSVTDSGNGAELSYSKKGTLLEEIFDAEISAGVLEGTEKTDLYGTFLDENEVKINGIKMNYEGESIHHLLGHRVDYFCSTSSSVPTLLFITESPENDVTTVYSDEISGFNLGVFTYFPENSSGEKSVKVPSGTPVLRNGVLEGYTGTIDVSAILNVERGNIKFINNEGTKGIDCISMTEYEVNVCDSVNTELEIIYFKNSRGMLALGNEYTPGEKEVSYTLNYMNKPADLDDVLEWDAVLVAKSQNKSGKLFYDIEIVRRKVSGTVTAIGDENVYIDDVPYTIAPSFNTGKLKPGSYGDFVIAGNDEIADTIMLRSYAYGFLMGVKNRDGIDNTAVIKIMTEAGEIETLTLNEKINFNSSVIRCENAIAMLENNYMLIAYKKNQSGKITTIFTDRGTGKIETEFSMDANHTSLDSGLTGYDQFKQFRTDAFFYSEPFFNGLYQPSPECVIFYVHPSVLTSGNPPKDDQIKVGGSTSITSTIDVTTTTDDAIVRAQMFDTDEFYRAGAIVIYDEDTSGGSPASSYKSVMLIDSVTKAIVDGDEIYKIRYYKDGSVEPETAYADPSLLYKARPFSDFKFRYHDDIESFEDLKCGDVIQAGTDKKGYVSSWRPVFLMNREYKTGEYWSGGTNYYNNVIDMFRTKVKLVDSTEWIAPSTDSAGNVNDRFFRLTKGDMAECFVYDSERKTLTMYPDMSILSEIVPGAEVFTIQTYKRTVMHIVIK